MWTPSCRAGSHSSPFPVRPCQRVRSAAVQLLVSYMGATLGSLAAVRAFVQQAVDGYRCVRARRSLGASIEAGSRLLHLHDGTYRCLRRALCRFPACWPESNVLHVAGGLRCRRFITCGDYTMQSPSKGFQSSLSHLSPVSHGPHPYAA